MSDQPGGQWHTVAKTSEVDEDEPKRVSVGTTDIAVCKVGDRFYAIDDICTHEYASLSDGFVEGDAIECPLHQARFHIPTGKVLTAPATEDLRTYPVKVEGDDILVQVPDG